MDRYQPRMSSGSREKPRKGEVLQPCMTLVTLGCEVEGAAAVGGGWRMEMGLGSPNPPALLPQG